MPRRPRIKLAGTPQHLVQRGVNHYIYGQTRFIEAVAEGQAEAKVLENRV